MSEKTKAQLLAEELFYKKKSAFETMSEEDKANLIGMTGQDLLDLGHQCLRFFRGIQFHSSFICGRRNTAYKAFLFQHRHLPCHIALVDANAFRQLILGDAGLGANLHQITGMAAFQTHGG